MTRGAGTREFQLVFNLYFLDLVHFSPLSGRSWIGAAVSSSFHQPNTGGGTLLSALWGQVCLLSLSILVEFIPGQDVISHMLGRVCGIKVNNLPPRRMSNTPLDIKVGCRLAEIANIPRKDVCGES